MNAAYRAAALALLLAFVGPASACIGTPLVKANPTAPARPLNSAAVTQAGLQMVFDNMAPFDDYRPNTKTSFSCVDSRGDQPQLGAFGGDFGEFAGATALYLKMTGVNTKDQRTVVKAVDDLFKAFMSSGNITPERPFYFHSSQDKLTDVFKMVAAEGVPEPTVVPKMMPTDPATKAAWLKAITYGKNQGCGHVRLMIDNYPEYGLDSAFVPQALIKSFFEYFWSTEAGAPEGTGAVKPDSLERQLTNFVLKPGGLNGRAIAVIETTGACQGQSPMVPPMTEGAQAFIFHPAAVTDFRAKVLVPFFANYAAKNGATLDKAKFETELTSFMTKQLGATLKLLQPANELPLWTVTINAKPDAGH